TPTKTRSTTTGFGTTGKTNGSSGFFTPTRVLTICPSHPRRIECSCRGGWLAVSTGTERSCGSSHRHDTRGLIAVDPATTRRSSSLLGASTFLGCTLLRCAGPLALDGFLAIEKMLNLFLDGLPNFLHRRLRL